LTPLAVSLGLWAAWVVSWGAASVWTRRTAAQPSIADQAAHLVPTIIGALLIAAGARLRMGAGHAPLGLVRLWATPAAVGWALSGVTALGFAFTWWARIWLGSLWSSAVGRKEGHTIVASGPYAIVRHPIYTGLIAALLALALQLGSPLSLLGVALITFGFWTKARLEERFLSQELGSETYAAYRARTPMLVPFWSQRG